MATADVNLDDKQERQLPGRRDGVVLRVTTRDKGFIFLIDHDQQEYFAHKSGFKPQALINDLVNGDPVNFRASETSKGLRAWNIVRAVDAEAQAKAEALEERRGNV